jgi:Leucine-rich repeat (LRR) protein
MPRKRASSRGKRDTPTTELALKLIEENRRTKSPFLDLGNCGLTQFPPELEELPWLETLVLAPRWEEWTVNGWMVCLSQNKGKGNDFRGRQHPLAPLPLKKLHINQTALGELRPLSGLRELETLSLSKNPIKDLSPLSHLARLNELAANSTGVSNLSPLTNFSDLRVLSAGGTRVANLSPLKNLDKMEVLYAWATQVEDLSSLRELKRLERLVVTS